MPKYLLSILPFLLFGLGVEAQIIIIPQPERKSNDLELGGETPLVNNETSSYGPTSQVQQKEAWLKYLQLQRTDNGGMDRRITPVTPGGIPSSSNLEIARGNVNSRSGIDTPNYLRYNPTGYTVNEDKSYEGRIGDKIDAPNSYGNGITRLEAYPATHTVARGETLYSISKQYNLSIEDIQNWNDLNSSIIRRGQVLNIIAPSISYGRIAANRPISHLVAYDQGDQRTITDNYKMHIVKPGESLASIALKYGYTSSRFRDINDLGPNDYLRVGQRLKTTHCDCQSQAITPGQSVTTSVSPNSYNRTGERVPAYYTSPINYAQQSKRVFYQSVFLDAATRYQTNNGGPYFYYEADQSGTLNDLQELIYLTERSVNTARQSQYQAIFGGSSLADQPSVNWTYAQNNLINTKIAQQPLNVSDRNQLANSYQKLNAYYQSLRDQQNQLQAYYNSNTPYLNAADNDLLVWLLGNGGQMLTSLEQSLNQIEGLYALPILETNYAAMLSLIERLKVSRNLLAQTPTFAQSPANYQQTTLAGLQLLLTN